MLPRRVPGYRPEHLDALTASGEVVWVGAGPDRVALYFREDAAALGQVPARAARPRAPSTTRFARRSRGALFWDELLARDAARRGGRAARALGSRLGGRGDERRVDAAARGAALRRAEGRSGGRGASRAAACRAPTATAGRWSRTERLFAGAPDRRALAELLLERQGIVTRDGVRAEGIPGGYGAVYAELRALETLGLCRRGYFVEGLGGAQFALGGAVERLRELRERPEDADALVLAAADPAQPYGAALPWPKRAGARAARVAGAYVVLARRRAGALRRARRPVARAAARSRRRTGCARRSPRSSRTCAAGGAKRLAVERFDGEPVVETDAMALLVEAGFLAGPRRAVLRA